MPLVHSAGDMVPLNGNPIALVLQAAKPFIPFLLGALLLPAQEVLAEKIRAQYWFFCKGDGIYNAKIGEVICKGNGNILSSTHTNRECIGGVNRAYKDGLWECSSNAFVGPRGQRILCQGESTIDSSGTINCHGHLSVPDSPQN